MASCWFSSMLTLTSFRFFSSEIFSSTGETARQGPHHSAQKSTSTGSSLFRTSSSKVDSVTAFAIPESPFVGSGEELPVLPALTTLASTLNIPDGQTVSAAAPNPRQRGARARDPGLVGEGACLRPAAGAEPRRPALELHRRADHREQPDGRPPRLGADAEGSLPALPRAPWPGRAVSERLRLPGPLGRGRGGEVPRPQLQA